MKEQTTGHWRRLGGRLVAIGSLVIAVAVGVTWPGTNQAVAQVAATRTPSRPAVATPRSNPRATPTAGQSAVPAPPEVTAQGAILVDDETGLILYEKNAHQRFAPASTTKIVTAAVALERDYLEHVIRVNVHWMDFADSTLMGLEYGERLTLEALLYGMLLPSGNDAATQIAKEIAGTEADFAKLMNAKARELGLVDSHFVNPHGLDAEGHYSSAYDLTVFGRYDMRNPEFARIVGSKNPVVYGQGVYPLRNTNHLVYDYPGADGIKTGYTDNAGLALVATAERDGHRAFATVMKSQNNFLDCRKLLDYYFDNRAALIAAARANSRALSGGGARANVLPPVTGWTTPVWPRGFGGADNRRDWEVEFRYLNRKPVYWMFKQPKPSASPTPRARARE